MSRAWAERCKHLPWGKVRGRKGRHVGRSLGGLQLHSCLVPCNIGVDLTEVSQSWHRVVECCQKGYARLNSYSQGRSMGLNVREPGFWPSSANKSHQIGV